MMASGYPDSSLALEGVDFGDATWRSQVALSDYPVAFDSEDVQRRVMERIFQGQPPDLAMEDPSNDAALMMAAREVRSIARSFGKAEGDFADKWVKRVMATEDPRARLDILDECFLSFDDERLDCEALSGALRRFRMLLAPHTAMVKHAKSKVRALAAKLDAPRQRFVEIWMNKLQKGQKAEDPSEVLGECLITVSSGRASSKDCFDFEEALRNFKAAADLWAFQP